MTTSTLDVSLEQLEAATLRLDSKTPRLAYRPLDSVDATDANGGPSSTENWIDEIEQQVQAFLDNKVDAVDGEYVLREARTRVR